MSSARRARDDDRPKAPLGTRAPKGIGNSAKLMFSTTATASSMRVETRALRRGPSTSEACRGFATCHSHVATGWVRVSM